MIKNLVILILVCCLLITASQVLFCEENPQRCKIYLKSWKFWPVELTIDKKTDYYIAGRLSSGEYVTYFMDEIKRIEYLGPEEMHVLPTKIEEKLVSVSEAAKIDVVSSKPERVELLTSAEKQVIRKERSEIIDKYLDVQEELLPEEMVVSEGVEEMAEISSLPKKDTQMAKSLELAKANIDSGDLKKGLSCCKEALSKDPDNSEVLYLMGRIYLLQGLKNRVFKQINKLRSIGENKLADKLSGELGNYSFKKKDPKYNYTF